MAKYLPPSWFVKQLKLLSPRLTVFWNQDLSVWEIAELVKKPIHFGKNEWNLGAAVVTRPEKVMYIPPVAELGSKILWWLRRNRTDMYGSIEEFDKKMSIPYGGY